MNHLKGYGLFEGRSVPQSISFKYDDDVIEIGGLSKKDLYSKVIEWLYLNHYEFDNTSEYRSLISKDRVDQLVKNTSMRYDKFYQIKNTDKYVITNFIKEYQDLIFMLEDFGVTEILINGEFVSVDGESKVTFARAAQIILRENDNRPMSSREIWEEISERGLISAHGKTPADSLNAIMLFYSSNTKTKHKYKTSLFEIVGSNPIKFKLISPNEVQDVDEEDKLIHPLQITPVVKSLEDFKDPENPFGGKPGTSALCVLGKSGSGKSTTTENILESKSHIYDLITPTATSTSLLSQYSPSKGDYIPSRLGRLIMRAHGDSKKCYTAIIDECHKSSVIEMINDELLQAISTRRNRGERFISLDDDTAKLYVGLKESRGGNLLIPSNFGFIFLSSNVRVITSNPDFFNRVDIAIFPTKPKEEREKYWKGITDFGKLPYGIITDADEALNVIKKESQPEGSLYITRE